jgi:hypothetical protein
MWNYNQQFGIADEDIKQKSIKSKDRKQNKQKPL